ncbi:MAG: GtrA family protein [Firmicutes bacterium]|nr:GtrA family protein [Bacillota bacterium]
MSKPNQSDDEVKNKIIVDKHIWEFIKYTSVSLLTSLVEISVFALFNYWIFSSLSQIEIQIWLLDYSLANGGLCSFLAFSLSFIIAQIFNFIVQRKATFKANNRVLSSAIMYGIMILIIFLLQLWIPTLIHVPISNLVGNDWADLIIKNMMMFLAFIIQYPMNKWVIMKKVEQI